MVNYGATDNLTNDEETRPLLESSRSTDLTPVRRYSRLVRLKNHMWADVDPDQATLPLVYYCFMTGFMYVLCRLERKKSLTSVSA